MILDPYTNKALADRDARIAELEAELVEAYEVHCANHSAQADYYKTRLAAVIALTADLPDRGPFLPLLNKIRAAATGETSTS